MEGVWGVVAPDVVVASPGKVEGDEKWMCGRIFRVCTRSAKQKTFLFLSSACKYILTGMNSTSPEGRRKIKPQKVSQFLRSHMRHNTKNVSVYSPFTQMFLKNKFS
jgi:hypothetical protein